MKPTTSGTAERRSVSRSGHEPLPAPRLEPGDASLCWALARWWGGEVCGILFDEAEQGRAAGVLPGQAQEVQAGDLGHAASVYHSPVLDRCWDVDPGVVGRVAGRPDYAPDGIQCAAVGEADRSAVSLDESRPEPYADPAEPPLVGAGDELPPTGSPRRP